MTELVHFTGYIAGWGRISVDGSTNDDYFFFEWPGREPVCVPVAECEGEFVECKPKWASKKRVTYADSRTTGSGGRCRAKCVGGNACQCNARYLHAYHCCKKPLCLCHSELMFPRNRKVEVSENGQNKL